MKKTPPIFKAMVGMVLSAIVLSGPATQAQTVLSGDHVVEGNLDVGTTNDKGNLKVTGETGNSASPAMEVTGDGGVVFRGTLGTGTIPTGSGPLFLWYPKKAAFRIGRQEYYTYELEDEHIGEGSVAFGNFALAKGTGSFALENSEAYATESVAMSGGRAMGGYSTAMNGGYAYGTGSAAMSGGSTYGANSTAMSNGAADEANSTAMSGGYAVGIGSTAMSNGTAYGTNSTAMSGGYTNENYSTAMSGGTTVGTNSTAMSGGTAYGANSTAMSGGYTSRGYSTAMSGGLTEGDYSTAIGRNAVASSYQSVVVGSWNEMSGYEISYAWEPTDFLFVIGNGTGKSTDPLHIRYSNAFVVLKNGNIEMKAKVKMPRQGDILMGEFGEPEP